MTPAQERDYYDRQDLHDEMVQAAQEIALMDGLEVDAQAAVDRLWASGYSRPEDWLEGWDWEPELREVLHAADR